MSDPVMPVIIALPPEMDLTNASDVLELITAACAPGVPVVIADLTSTSFCDSSGLQQLIKAGHKAAANGTELRLAIAPGGAVSRIIKLTGISQYLPVYPTTQLAADGGGQSAQPAAADGGGQPVG
jgi:anti-sigma B factor antagonist